MDCLKLFSDPNLFINQWIKKEVEKQELKNQERAEKKKLRKALRQQKQQQRRSRSFDQDQPLIDEEVEFDVESKPCY